jgi:hypothetical protein
MKQPQKPLTAFDPSELYAAAPFPAAVSVTIRLKGDPQVVAEEESRGVMNFGLTTWFVLAQALYLLVLGSVLLLFQCCTAQIDYTDGSRGMFFACFFCKKWRDPTLSDCTLSQTAVEIRLGHDGGRGDESPYSIRLSAPAEFDID